MISTEYKEIKSSGFSKKADSLTIKGTRISYHNAQLLTSSGASTLDAFLGGGFAVGTLNIIEEDIYHTYSTLLMKYFLAEGLANKHSIFLASGDNPSKTLQELPSVKSPEQTTNKSTADESYEMKIAWRYKNVAKTDVNKDSYSHDFDMSQTMPIELLDSNNLVIWNPSEHYTPLQNTNSFLDAPYITLLQKIDEQIKNGSFKTGVKSCDNILRIGVCSVGSPLWSLNGVTREDLLKFLYGLKSLLRTSFSVALVTVPAILLQDAALKSRIRQMSDTVLELESFVGSDRKANPLFKDIDGLFYIRKLPVLNTIVYQVPASDLGFKVKRKGFFIQRLHLPPDIEDTSHMATSCSGTGSSIDF